VCRSQILLPTNGLHHARQLSCIIQAAKKSVPVALLREGLARLLTSIPPAPAKRPSSFADLVSKHVTRPRIYVNAGFALAGVISTFVPSISAWFIYCCLGIAALILSDVLMVMLRNHNGSYGNNDLEVAEAAQYLIQNGASKKANASETGGAVAGVR
jgi:hypothetical protein